MAYVSMLTENATALLAEFKKKYPFIDTSLYRANTQKLLPKIQLEARTQQHAGRCHQRNVHNLERADAEASW